MLKENIKEKRVIHCQAVMEEAAYLAQKVGADIDKARTAGLLHDYARDIPEEQLLKLAKQFDIKLNHIDFKLPVLLHGPVGAELVKRDLGINDEEILEAVAFHTTAAPNLSLLGKIIYIADIIEPSRNFDGVEKIRKLAEKGDINTAVFEAINSSIKYCILKNRLIHPITIEARNELLENKKEIVYIIH